MDIAPATEPADGPDEEIGPRRPRRRGGAWLVAGLVAVGVVVAVAQGVTSGHPARHATGPSPTQAPSPTPARSASAQQYVAGVGDLAGDRCPTAVSCGVSDSVAASMLAAMHADFPAVTVQLQLRAFDAAHPTTYWQQAQGRLPSGATVVLTEQRTPTAASLQTVTTSGKAADGFVVVSTRRGTWHLSAELIGSGPLPVNAAAHWVRTAPVPR